MKEHEIRPQTIFDEYLRLTELDTKTYFADAPRNEVACPACGGVGKPAFEKSGFQYTECQGCLSLYVSPRPASETFQRYYRESPSTRFWATTFYKETESARREKIWKPKARLVKDKVALFSNAEEIVDIGGGYGTFAEEIRNITDWNVVVIEPSPALAQICRQKGLPVVEKFLEHLRREDLSDKQRCFVSFELFEHLYDPAEFLRRLNGLMKNGDLFIFTTLSGLGVDIQVLWEHSKAVAPPHHLNFFNPWSIRQLLEKTGFKPIEITTPGKLDMDILENNLPSVHDRFWRNYFHFATTADKENMQTFVSDNRLSSHMMVVCVKM